MIFATLLLVIMSFSFGFALARYIYERQYK